MSCMVGGLSCAAISASNSLTSTAIAFSSVSTAAIGNPRRKVPCTCCLSGPRLSTCIYPLCRCYSRLTIRLTTTCCDAPGASEQPGRLHGARHRPQLCDLAGVSPTLALAAAPAIFAAQHSIARRLRHEVQPAEAQAVGRGSSAGCSACLLSCASVQCGSSQAAGVCAQSTASECS